MLYFDGLVCSAALRVASLEIPQDFHLPCKCLLQCIAHYNISKMFVFCLFLQPALSIIKLALYDFSVRSIEEQAHIFSVVKKIFFNVFKV